MIRLREIGVTLKKAYILLKKNDPLILSSSTAFFTTFSLSPILIILMDLLKPILGKEVIHKELFSKIQQSLGTVAARDVHTIVDGFEALESNIWFTILSTLFFYFVATTLLSVVKQAMHKIWSFKPKEKVKTMYHVKERLTGIAMMLSFAVLITISYSMDIAEANLDHHILSGFAQITFSLLFVATWFTLLFKFLPEAHVPWTIATTGGLFTGFFFKIGTFLLSKILIHKQVFSIFGVSSSIAMLLLFIFYSSFILYLGVAFMLEFSKATKKTIRPGKDAIEFREQITVQGN
ncbi:N/A [soil metagenome]